MLNRLREAAAFWVRDNMTSRSQTAREFPDVDYNLWLKLAQSIVKIQRKAHPEDMTPKEWHSLLESVVRDMPDEDLAVWVAKYRLGVL